MRPLRGAGDSDPDVVTADERDVTDPRCPGIPKLHRGSGALGCDRRKLGSERTWHRGPGELVATGTNPEVQSLYLAENPAIEGHNVNLAHGSATVGDLVVQAGQAVDLDPVPDLVVIQIMDADMVCPAKDSDYASFRATFEEALATLTEGVPDADIFVVSQFGSPSNVKNVLPTRAEREQIGGTGPCAFVDPDGEIVPKELQRLEDIIHGYEAQLEAGCDQFDRCHYDDGAFGRIVDQHSYWSSCNNHLSIEGHAKAAAVAWAALRRADIVP
jgi:hypothetical protein